jgi:parallel beta-helix repeat protein
MKTFSARRLISLLSASALVATLAVAALPAAASAAAPPAPYFNGFEHASDAISPMTSDTQAMFDVTRVSSGTDSITSASGSWHAVAAQNTGNLDQFTRLGGYSNSFPVGGYTTSIDVYLDMTVATGSNDLRFDWSSAISDTSATPGHRRDFVFSVGTSIAGNVPGQFVMSASNNSPGWPANPGRDPMTVSTTGWYTFQHTFRDAGAGVLAVDMRVLNASNAVLHTWTLSDPTDIIGTTVGGNRYGWLVTNGFPTLALDNITRSGVTCTQTGFTRDGINLTAAQIGGTVTGTLNATGCNIGAYNPSSVTNATIVGANYFGVVANGGTHTVTGSTIRNIGEVPFNGSQHGVGIFFTGASGTISGNTVSLYQKGGIVVRDGGKVTINDNSVTGAGGITYIAQNGIQVSFGTSAKLFGNDVSRNNYTPSKVTACGLLIYKAGGVSGEFKAGIAYIKADNNFHNNETNICNFGKGGGFSL